MKVFVTHRLPSSTLARLASCCDVELHEGAALPAEVLAERVRDAHGLICVVSDRIDRGLLESARTLRVVANVAVGYDNIDVTAARDRGVIVTNTPDVLTGAVAEFTWGLILAVARRIAEGDRLVRRSGWKGWALDFMLGTELAGRRLGIVGHGRIGRAVAVRARAFGMPVVFAGRPGPREGPDRIDGAAVMTLDELLVTSDVVSLHVPQTPETRHLIDRRALLRMKRSAFLVNTARGPIVDEDALCWAIESGLIAGAALDVYEREPAVHPRLCVLENVVLAPHLGSATRDTRTAMADLAAANVVAVLEGRPPLTPVAA